MSRVFLIFASALVALMAGALFYAARIPVESSAPPVAAAPTEQPAQLEVVTHPAFTLPDVSGTDRQFSEWAGKNRILNFWATWCAPCRREIPLLKAFQDEQGDNGFQVIGIAVDFAESVANYAEAAEFNYPVLVGEQDAMGDSPLRGDQNLVIAQVVLDLAIEPLRARRVDPREELGEDPRHGVS